MIREGVANITGEEEKALDAFLKDLEKFHNRRSRIHKDASDKDICASLSEYSNTIAAPKYGVNLILWTFGYSSDTYTKAAYSAPHKEILLNLAHTVGNSKLPLCKQKIDFKKIAVNVYHEWTHFKQDLLYRKATGKPLTSQEIYAGKAYHDAPEEQMAFARGELEWIKQQAKKTNPQEILKWIKKWGLVQNEQIANLKKTNSKAYKRMLKYLVLYVLKKQAELEKGSKK